jgi:hypothetical protein
MGEKTGIESKAGRLNTEGSGHLQPVIMPPDSELLTQEEVDALPDGAEVIITWSGGNGPWIYKIGSIHGEKYTLDSVTGELNSPLTCIGKTKWSTKVWSLA